MSEQSFTDEEGVPDTVAIESKLPLNAIDIESQKDMESGRYHSLRSLHKWFAARPTPAVRLAVLASVYPGEIDSDELLRLMKIGPKELDSGLAEFVENKFTEEKGSGTLDDHYGYPNPNTQSPTKAEIEKLQGTLREAWGGDLPTILDPTAGRGIIPFEAIRYGLPVKANELNPVPSLILKAGLEYAPKVGSLDSDFRYFLVLFLFFFLSFLFSFFLFSCSFLLFLFFSFFSFFLFFSFSSLFFSFFSFFSSSSSSFFFSSTSLLLML